MQGNSNSSKSLAHLSKKNWKGTDLTRINQNTTDGMGNEPGKLVPEAVMKEKMRIQKELKQERRPEVEA